MKLAYAQMKVLAGRPDLNTKKILKFIDEARTQGADVVIFPEFAISGFMLGEENERQILDDCRYCMNEIMLASKDIFVIFHSEFFGNYPDYMIVKDGIVIGDSVFPLKIDLVSSDEEIEGEDMWEDMDLRVNTIPNPFSIKRTFPIDNLHCRIRPMISVGCVGIQNTGKTIYTFDGQSAIYNSRGELVQIAEPFKECLNFVKLEEIDKMPALEMPEVSDIEKIYLALHYGVKEFLSQIGMKKVVIGVSGGIDSAVAAALYVQVVGAENVYLVNMPSKFNSSTTKNLSEQLANNLGCKYFVVPIQESVDWTVKQLEERGIEVSSFVKENIQARDRSSRILAAIAASIGGVFTCNANKAETTVGYATLYGDEAGFLSALADLWKFQVYDLARYMNEKIYKREVIPQGIIDIVPSAELSTAQNVDEGKGDPLKYPYHDYLFRAFVEKYLTPEDILKLYVSGELEKEIGCQEGLVKKYFPTTRAFIEDLERWWRQFTGIGIAKRIQSPPILAVTNHPFGARLESQNGVHFTKKYLELKERLPDR